MIEALNTIGMFLTLYAIFYYIYNFQEINKEYGKVIKKFITNARWVYAEMYGPSYQQFKETFPFKKKIDTYKSNFHPNIKYHRRMMKPNKE